MNDLVKAVARAWASIDGKPYGNDTEGYDVEAEELLRRSGLADRIEADAKVIEAAKALKDDVLEVQAYRAQCKNGSVNLSALALKMQKVEQSLAAFNEALKAEQEKDDE